MKKPLDLYKAPLNGTNLIEANAGTGKTYNITGLFTRMLTESSIPVESILVVTYTKAAVSDLKTKIYRRLCEVRDAMSARLTGAEFRCEDPFPAEYAEIRHEHLAKDIKNLKAAVRDFDRCSVFTIHSFCQRMLKEHAFSGRIAYDTELTGDAAELIRKPVYDFWRKNVYNADPAVIPYLVQETPDKLINFYKQVQNNMSVQVRPPEKFTSEDDFKKCEKALKDIFGKVSEEYANSEADIKALARNTKNQQKWLDASFTEMDQKIRKGDFRCILEKENKKIHRLMQSEINAKSKTGELPHPFFSLVEKWYKLEEEFREAAESMAAAFRYRLYEYMRERLERHKQESDLQSYDDLIVRMRNAVLENSGKGEMTAGIREKYKAALIDEFQDTDPYQYDIFSTAFRNLPFFMIGDPKQAIYSFRGADVYAYLKAAEAEGNKYTLTENYRSDPELVDSVNVFFRSEKPFLLDEIKYEPSKGAIKGKKLTIDGRDQPPMTVWEAKEAGKENVAAATARHIAELLNKSEAGNASLGGERIQPADIAVLCRSGQQMSIVKKALAECRVPAVVSGSDSVFESDEAVELTNFLSAVISPFSQRHVKTALATSIFGFTAKQIFELADSEEWNSITEEFRLYSDIITSKGFAPMFFAMAKRRRLYERTAAMPGGERKLTNLIHLTELAQQYEMEKQASPQDILSWLKEKNTEEEKRNDEAELKMDSDENAVTIITIHKSKGLEYNIVYTPFLMIDSKNTIIKTYPKYHTDEGFILDSADTQDSRIRSQEEEMAEDLRIAYVALTRAKYACFTAWGPGYRNASTAIGYLINGEHSGYDSSKMADFFRGTKVRISPMPEPIIQVYRAETSPPSAANRKFAGAIPAQWQINSFSGLVHSASAAKDTDQFVRTEKDEHTGIDIFSFPKGAKAGTCLHDCMENTDFENCTHITLMPVVTEKLEKYSIDPVFAPSVADNIMTTVEKDMNGVSLARLKKGEYIHEMEFQMSSSVFTGQNIADIFRKYGEADFAGAAETLKFETAQGYLNGFADLIFIQNGRYYVLDWKSNHLGNSTESYSHDRMHAEMLGSHYYLQMYIYILALHRHLRRNLTGYSYETHMGGGIYIFMRGINRNSGEGIYQHLPRPGVINDLEELMKWK